MAGASRRRPRRFRRPRRSALLRASCWLASLRDGPVAPQSSPACRRACSSWLLARRREILKSTHRVPLSAVTPNERSNNLLKSQPPQPTRLAGIAIAVAPNRQRDQAKGERTTHSRSDWPPQEVDDVGSVPTMAPPTTRSRVCYRRRRTAGCGPSSTQYSANSISNSFGRCSLPCALRGNVGTEI
jgi:hypothetical protein